MVTSSSNDKHARRVHAIARHLRPDDAAPPAPESITAATCASNDSQVKPTYASVVNGQPSSYARVHGQVSTAPVQWRRIECIGQHTLEEVLYDKGEGIAKVAQMMMLRLDVVHTPPQITINRPHKRNAFTPRTGTSAPVTVVGEHNNHTQWTRCRGV